MLLSSLGADLKIYKEQMDARADSAASDEELRQLQEKLESSEENCSAKDAKIAELQEQIKNNTKELNDEIRSCARKPPTRS